MSLIAIMTGILAAIAVYLLMSSQLSRWLYGLILLSSAINISLLLAGRVFLAQPAFIGSSLVPNIANPLPQALVLTAIVIAFALISFSFIILMRLHRNDALTQEDDVKKAKVKL
ncbi:MAG: cation:proton antiporter [Alphaproteobacteria bacterium]|nr:cation:proton antiporter [Alphaproteobacteria bacterium]|tara:strand:- start:1932 stop:2273 length:342 start_codon:yes stop_codon:yes gene_type:complete